MDDLITFIAILVFLYILYKIATFVWSVLCRIGRRIDPRYEARTRRVMQRVVKRARIQQKALKEVVVDEAKTISDVAAYDIFRRR